MTSIISASIIDNLLLSVLEQKGDGFYEIRDGGIHLIGQNRPDIRFNSFRGDRLKKWAREIGVDCSQRPMKSAYCEARNANLPVTVYAPADAYFGREGLKYPKNTPTWFYMGDPIRENLIPDGHRTVATGAKDIFMFIKD